MRFGDKLDKYTVRARIVPALLVALPLVLTAFAWFPHAALRWSAAWGILTWCGGAFLLAQLGRDTGKRKEPRLFRSWGGKPTTKMLRHRDTRNAIILDRRHKKLRALMRTVRLPSPEEESANPRVADEIYESCTAFLREKTRDTKKFTLVFEENCNYGLRRNLWGMKPFGLTIAFISLAGIVAVSVVDPNVEGNHRFGLVAVPALIDLLLLFAWVFVITPRWVRVAAEAYAERLLEACERL